MAAIFKRRYTAYRKNPVTGEKEQVGKRKTAKYYIKYRDEFGGERCVAGFTDFEKTRRKALTIEGEVEELSKCLQDPLRAHQRRQLSEHLEDFRTHLAAKANTPKQVRQKYTRASHVITGCGFTFIKDLSASRVQSFLADLREDRPEVEGRIKRGGYQQADQQPLPGSDQAFR